MNRMVKKLMVVLLSAFMFMGVMTTPVQAKGSTSGTNGWNPWGWFWGWGYPQPTQPEQPEPEPTEEPGVDEETPMVEEPVIEEETEVVYAPISVEEMAMEGSDTLSVSIDAPADAFPAGTEVFAKVVPNEDVQDIIDASENVDGTVLAAVDITFMLGEEELQPSNDQIVNVSITAKNLIAEAESLDVVHIDSETEEAESVGLINIDTEEEAVSFDADSFSTYVIVGQQRNITAHYGFMEGNTFIPFASRNISSISTSYPTNGINQNQYNNNNPDTYLIYDFPGYTYKETRLSTATGTIIWPVLHRADTSNPGRSYNWQYTTSQAGGNPTWSTFSNNNNNVYIIYEAKVIKQGIPIDDGEGGGEGGQQDVPELPAGKNVEPNGDGTYDITLSVTGKANETEDIKKASVIVIFDTSNSMNNNMAGNSTNQAAQRRVNIAKTAVNELADTLLNIVDEKTNEHLVQMALITFDDKAQIKSLGGEDYTTDLTTYTNAVNGIQLAENGAGATNWEAALLEANSLEVPQDAPTYVVFVSDGDPTYRLSRVNDTDANVRSTTQLVQYANGTTGFSYDQIGNGLFGTGTRFVQGHYDAAVRVAQEIKGANKEFYTIGLSSQGARMQNLAVAVEDASHYFPGNSPEELAAAFAEIASAVRDSIGYTDVEIDDGVTELTTVEADALTGTPKDFVYRKGANGDDPTQNAVWEGAPTAEITEDNHVIWDVASIGTLEPGVTYSVTFTVWPSQRSYDIIADINNGIIRDAEGNIIRNGTPAEAYAAQPDDVKVQIGIVNGVYTLLTNTGANISYKYNGVDGSNEVTVKKSGAMPLDTSYFGIEKEWVNQLPQDSRTAQVLTKQDEDGEYYLIDSNGEWILENDDKIKYDRENPRAWQDKAVYYVDLIITSGDEDYTEVRLTSDTADGQSAWTWDQMFIAPGVITHDKNATSGTIEVLETGHEYSVREKPSDSYYWELTAETYHPMVINGETIVLQEVTENAPEMDNNSFNGDYYCFDNIVYKKLGTADEALIKAVNNRRSYLNLTKNVVAEDAPADALFEYTIKITDPNGEELWFSAFDPEIENEDGTKGATVMNLQVTGATAEEGNTGYWHVPSEQEFTIKIEAGWNVRFTNLVSGTEYEITESVETMDEGFVFESVGATAEVDGTAQDYTVEIEEAKISGTIENPNTDYTVTYKNDYLGYFYVYHSSDNSIERFPKAVNGVEVTTFNIVNETKDNTLYGGYYDSYAGAVATDAEINGTAESGTITYDSDNLGQDKDGAQPYNCTYILDENREVWSQGNPYTAKGTEMQPAKNGVYYLKEVPVVYSLPYTHYTYNKSDKVLRNMWYISSTDDLQYSEAGFFVETVDENGKKTGIFVDTLTVKNASGGATVTLTPKSVFGNKGGAGNGVKAGYLTYWDASSLIKAGEVSIFTPYWKTPDEIYVCGTDTRTVTFNNGKVGTGGMRVADEANDYAPLDTLE